MTSSKKPVDRIRARTGLPRMEDVAIAAGVSKAAVSHVLNNRLTEISSETRQRILGAIKSTGYRPAATRKIQAREQFSTLGFVVTTDAAELTGTGYFARIFRGVLSSSQANESHVTVFMGNLFDVDTEDKVRYYCDGRCDGLILCALRLDSPLPSILSSRGTPYVLIGTTTDQPDAISVDVDNEHGIASLINYLRQLGHTRIAFCPGPSFVSSAPQRLAAYYTVMELTGCAPQLTPVGDDDNYLKDLAEWVQAVRRQPPSERITAVVCWNDIAAIILSKHLTSAGLSIPDDISIVGFDDSPGASLQEPALTSYQQPYEKISETAFNLAIAQFRHETIEPRTLPLKGKLVIRGSVRMIQD